MKNNDSKKSVRLVILGVICVLTLFTILPRVKTIWDLSQQKVELKQQKAELTRINISLEKKHKQLSSPAAVEKIAREQLGMVKNGEKFVIKVLPDTQKAN